MDAVKFTLLETIGLSIVSGGLTVALLGVIRLLFSQGITKKINSGIQRNIISIEGKWRAEGKQKSTINGQTYEYSDDTEITQVGKRITGKSIYVSIENNGSRVTKEFSLEGFIRGQVVSGTYENLSNKSLGIGSFTLMISGDAKLLSGFYLIYNIDAGKVEQWPYELKLV